MENNAIKKEIEKYFLKPHSLPDLIKKSIVNEFVPVEMGSITIDSKSIIQSPIDKQLYEFSADSEITFEEQNSKVKITSSAKIHGIARLFDDKERGYVDAIEINSISPIHDLLSSIIKV